MLRPNAHHDHEIFSKYPPVPKEETRMNFPLPHVGDTSPDILTLQMLAKITFVFGFYFLVLRFTGVNDAGLAGFLAKLVAVIYGIALAVKLFTPERGEAEWVIWILALAALVLAVHWLFPGSFITPNWDGPNRTSLIEPMVQFVVLLLLLISVVAPAVKNVLLRKTRGELFVGAVAALLGGQFAAWSYSPESEFSAWSNLAALLIVAWMISVAITDQYVRFQSATSPALHFREESFSHGQARFLPLYQSFFGAAILAAAVWFGNLVFLHQFGKPGAALYGLAATATVLVGATVVFSLLRGQSPIAPFVEAWNATTFFAAYNLQQNDNPHAYQCSPWFRAPIMRFLTLGLGVTSVGLALFHLGGMQTPISEKDKRTPVPASWNRLLPQGYPGAVQSVARPTQGIEAYRAVAQDLVEKGDVVRAPRKDHSREVLLRSVALFLLGGPLGFLLLLAAVQGTYLAWVRSKLTALENESFEV